MVRGLALGISLFKPEDYGTEIEDDTNKPPPLNNFHEGLLKIVVYSLMEPLGVVIGTVLGIWLNGPALYITSDVLTSLGAGTFIYIATMDILAVEFISPILIERKGLRFFSCILALAITSAFIVGFDWDND